MEHAGYAYATVADDTTAPRRPGTTFYKCGQAGIQSNACMARAEETDGCFQLKEPHNHLPMVEGMRNETYDLLQDVHKFKTILKFRAFNEQQPLEVIYKETALVYPKSACWVPWMVANSLMLQVRNINILEHPKTLLDLSNMFENGQLDYFKCNDEVIFRGCLQDWEGTNSVVFACQSLIDAILKQKSLEMYVDTSYTTLMFKPKFKQLLTIHFLVNSYSIPAVFCLMEKITDNSYDTVFSFISNKILIGYKPKIIITNFNPILRCSLTKYFYPDNIHGSLFIHSQDICKKIQYFGYLNLITYNYDAFICMKMLMALPFLHPTTIEEGFCTIKTYAIRLNVCMIKLFTYYEQYWLREIGCESISVYEKPFKTNNNIQLFHCKLMDMFEKRPTIWNFLNCLKTFNEIYSPQEQQIVDSRVLSNRILYSLLYEHELISNNIRHMVHDMIHTKHFLIIASEVFTNFETQRLMFISKIIATETETVDGSSDSESSSVFNVSTNEENNTAMLEFDRDRHGYEGHIKSNKRRLSNVTIEINSSDEDDDDRDMLLFMQNNTLLLSGTSNEQQNEEEQSIDNMSLLSSVYNEGQYEEQQSIENELLWSDTSDDGQYEEQHYTENELLSSVTSDEEQNEDQQFFAENNPNEYYLIERNERNTSWPFTNMINVENNLVLPVERLLSNAEHSFVRELEMMTIDDSFDDHTLQGNMSPSYSEYQLPSSEDESMSDSAEQRVGDQSMLEEVDSSSDSDNGASSQGFCMVCLTKKVTYKFLIHPCGHAWLCLKCKQKKMSFCPYCRITVESFTRILETSI